MPKKTPVMTSALTALGAGTVLVNVSRIKVCKFETRYKPDMTSEAAARSLAAAWNSYLKCVAKGFRRAE